jgi:cellulose synthase/poly-beta-1,6-N-acetylglucosamine synthase-like glycosyltransferase
MIFECVVFFTLALVITTAAAVTPGLIKGRFWLTLIPLAGALALSAWLFFLILKDSTASVALGIVVAALTILIRLLQPRWSWTAAQLFAAVVLAALSYLSYAGFQTYAGGLSPVVLLPSTVLLLLEIIALALSITYAFEVLDTVGRREKIPDPPPVTNRPWVALQVATYNEPLEIVRPTLESLARIDYPNLLVQVVDNNTKDEALWKGLEELCKQMGPRFQFMHLDPWPGFKAGALNEATKHLPQAVEIIGIIDADYAVEPTFLNAMIGHFDDPSVAFAQSSQHYRDWQDSRYLRGLFYSFRYFFDITMPCRAHRNAIIFCGTMGLLRKSVLEEIGGWSETCITEDAEASLRMLGHGYRGVYDPRAYGAGMMPLDFDGLKKQRFRWALGGIQLMRQWWGELTPFGRHQLKLTKAQRTHYLLGALQWFGEPLTAAFTVLLLATSLTTSLHHQLPIRQLTGAVLIIPLAFAGTGLLRALWAMRVTTHCTWRDALGALRIWFALSWVVTLACLRGLIRKNAEFLRTPKRKEGAAFAHALWTSRAETTLALAALVGGVAMIIVAPSLATISLGVLLIFEAFVYGSAPVASIGAERVQMTPQRQAWATSAQNTGDRPSRSRAAVIAGAGTAALAAAGAAAAIALVLSSPSDRAPFTGTGKGDLPRLGNVISGQAATTTPSPTASPSATASPSPSATVSASATPAPTPTPSATAAPTPTPAVSSPTP